MFPEHHDLYMFGWNESGQLAQQTNLAKPAECFSAVEKLLMACCTMQAEDAALPRGDTEDTEHSSGTDASWGPIRDLDLYVDENIKIQAGAELCQAHIQLSSFLIVGGVISCRPGHEWGVSLDILPTEPRQVICYWWEWLS